MTPKQIKKIETLKTENQLRKYLKTENIQIYKDNTQDIKSVSIWTDTLTRIYKPHGRKYYKVQKWEPVKVEMSTAGKAFFNNPDYLKNL